MGGNPAAQIRIDMNWAFLRHPMSGRDAALRQISDVSAHGLCEVRRHRITCEIMLSAQKQRRHFQVTAIQGLGCVACAEIGCR